MNHISSTISFILQGYGKTLLHRKCSELKKKHLFAEVLQTTCCSQENICVGVFF